MVGVVIKEAMSTRHAGSSSPNSILRSSDQVVEEAVVCSVIHEVNFM